MVLFHCERIPLVVTGIKSLSAFQVSLSSSPNVKISFSQYSVFIDVLQLSILEYLK